MVEFLIGLQHEKPQATDRNDPFLQAAMAVHGNQVLAALKKIQATFRKNEVQALRCTG